MNRESNDGNALYYERVSTTHEEQDESMENQRALARSFLTRHPEIKLAEPLGTYSERVSGKSDERPKYQQLLKRLEKGDIRYVMVKDLKRLNRSTEVSAQLGNYAKKYNFQFILLSTGQVFDPNSNENRMMYGFESLINQEVVYRQSEYSRLAHRQKCEAKRLNRNNITFGYKWDPEAKDIVIDEAKAEIIRALFDLYTFQDYGIMELRKFLESKGYKYSGNTVTKWLTETAYIGIFHLNKKGSELGVGVGMKTKRYTNPKEEWVPVERPDLAIVDEKIFNLAQQIRESRMAHFGETKTTKKDGTVNTHKQDRFRGTHLFSSKIVCAECGCMYLHNYSDRARTIGVYKDSYRIRTRTPLTECENRDFKTLYEEDLIEIMVLAVNNLIERNKDCIGLLMDTLREVIMDDTVQRKQSESINKEIQRLKGLLLKIQDRFIYADEELLLGLNQKYKEVKEQIQKLELREVEENQQINNLHNTQEVLREISSAIARWTKIDVTNVDKTVVNAFVDKMVIHKDGVLEIYLSTQKVLENQMPKHSKGKKRRSENSTSFSSAEPIQFSDKMQIREYWESLNNVDPCNSFKIFEFLYIEKIGNRKTGNKRKIKVTIIVVV